MAKISIIFEDKDKSTGNIDVNWIIDFNEEEGENGDIESVETPAKFMANQTAQFVGGYIESFENEKNPNELLQRIQQKLQKN